MSITFFSPSTVLRGLLGSSLTGLSAAGATLPDCTDLNEKITNLTHDLFTFGKAMLHAEERQTELLEELSIHKIILPIILVAAGIELAVKGVHLFSWCCEKYCRAEKETDRSSAYSSMDDSGVVLNMQGQEIKNNMYGRS